MVESAVVRQLLAQLLSRLVCKSGVEQAQEGQILRAAEVRKMTGWDTSVKLASGMEGRQRYMQGWCKAHLRVSSRRT